MPFDPNSIMKLFSLTPEKIDQVAPQMALSMDPAEFQKSLLQVAPTGLASTQVPMQGQGATPEQAGSWAGLLGLAPQTDSVVASGSPSNVAAGPGLVEVQKALGGMPALTTEQAAMLARMAEPAQVQKMPGAGVGHGGGGGKVTPILNPVQTPKRNLVSFAQLLGGR